MSKTICVCSSFKFYDDYLEMKKMWETSGIRVLGPVPHPKVRKQENPAEFMENLSDKEHEKIAREVEHKFLKKIRRADVIYVLAKNGYVGLSVSVEIGYAYGLGTLIFSSEKIVDFNVRSLINEVVGPEELLKKFKD